MESFVAEADHAAGAWTIGPISMVSAMRSRHANKGARTMALRLFDTLTNKLIPLEPRRPDAVRVYTCGPTTYDVAHVGHGRAAVAPDILVRHLRGQGHRVVYVRNITDVEDKILKRSSECGEAPLT